MFDKAINSKPAFETMAAVPGYASFKLRILSAFCGDKRQERAELAALFTTGTVDDFINFAEENFTPVPKSDTVCVEGSSAQRYFVSNADELTKIYDSGIGTSRILVPQYGFIAEVQKDIKSGEEIFKNISFFINDITTADSETLSSPKLKPYDAGIYADAVPADFNRGFGLYRLKA